MSLFSLFRQRASAPASRKRPTARLCLEALEDRAVPAGLGHALLPDPAELLDVPALARSAAVKHASPISGGISVDNGIFLPIGQEGSVITLLHPDDHELTGSLQGHYAETGTLTLDLSTGQGFFRADGVFDGTVLGSRQGTARLHIEGTLRSDDGVIKIDNGYFVLSHGQDGLADVFAKGTFTYTVGVGGVYRGLAYSVHIRLRASENGVSTITPASPTTLNDAFTTVGHSTFGGPFTGIGSDVINLATREVLSGQFTWTFHAGAVYGTYSGTVSFTGEDTADFQLYGVIEGGTGAFEGVTGWLSASGTGEFTDATTFVWSATIEGRLVR